MDKITYPKEIKVEVTALHWILLGLSLAMWPIFVYHYPAYVPGEWPRFCSVLGLFLNIVGATIASMRPRAQRTFSDGGDLQLKADAKASQCARYGMLIIALGFIVQAVKEIFAP